MNGCCVNSVIVKNNGLAIAIIDIHFVLVLTNNEERF